MMYIMPLKWTICWTKLWSFETPWRSCNVTLVDQKGIQISEQPLDQGQRSKSSQGMIITKIVHTCQQESWSSNDSVAPVENRPVRWVFVGAKQCHYRLQHINKRFLADLNIQVIHGIILNSERNGRYLAIDIFQIPFIERFLQLES